LVTHFCTQISTFLLFAWVYVLFEAIALYMEKYMNVFTVIYCTVYIMKNCLSFRFCLEYCTRSAVQFQTCLYCCIIITQAERIYQPSATCSEEEEKKSTNLPRALCNQQGNFGRALLNQVSNFKFSQGRALIYQLGNFGRALINQ
jgi:hypothetical protein